MGTDNLFHKRKARRAGSLRRTRAQRDRYDVVLIVCEGEKTEPLYFRSLRKKLRLNTANIEICGKECNSSPDKVVEFAITKYKKSKDYDRIYCIFDKDRHSRYQAALDRMHAIQHGSKVAIYGIPSVPCFEFWLLLHFKYTTRPFSAAGNKSSCDAVNKELRKHITGYQKRDTQIFQKTWDRIDNAIKNAQKIDKYHRTSGTDNPSTHVHKLVEYLMELAGERPVTVNNLPVP